MLSSAIFRVCFLMTGVHFLEAFLPSFIQQEDTSLSGIVVEISNYDGRIRRSNDELKQLTVKFNISSDAISFYLTHSKDIDTDVPIYTMNNAGKLELQQIPQLRNVRYYQDREHGASFMIQTNQSSLCMVAVFPYQGDEYLMEPNHCSSDRPIDILYSVVRLKRNPMSDRHTLKSDVQRKWSSKWMNKMKIRDKRQSTDYKIELFFIIDFSVYDYWHTQSKSTTLSDKDIDAKQNIRQFYSFVVNGIDLRYKSIQTSYKISVLFSGMYIADQPFKSQFVENYKTTTSLGTVVDSAEVLNAVRNWIKVTTELPQHDHAMMFTSDNNNCMTVQNSGGDETLEKYTSLPGEVYDADSQCRHIIGPGSSFCRGIYGQNFSSICTKLWCQSIDVSGLCISSIGGDGLRCGNKKWCILGECKYDECAPSGDENCLYGDSAGVVLRYPDKNMTCSFDDIKSRPSACYQVENKCCQQCKHFHTGITGCEYGDRVSGCTTFLCQQITYAHQCCGTCNNDSVVTIPSQEPTTPKYENPCKTTTTTLTPSLTSTVTSETTSVFVFRLTITLNIDILTNLSNGNEKANVISKIQAELTIFYQSNGLEFTKCTVRNIRKGSLIVEYDVLTRNESQSVTQMTTISKDMASGKSKVSYEGKEVTVSSVTLTDLSGDSLTISSSTTSCEFQSMVHPCSSGYKCFESNNVPICRESTSEDEPARNQVYLIIAGVGIPLLSIIIVSCVCYFHRKRQSKSNGATNDQMHGISNLAMEDFYQQRKQQYDKARY
uniref:Uncharacterized protein LOC111125156 isoform X2 n=1 Tax=Crassostrea virginica TaxID=6565 RepID=A0A8B8D8D9_CRAVI|nr:uncharacterized protein LOC111125156 isoform X2 [Crassostrea virginica]